MMIKSDSLKEGGSMYGYLHEPSERIIASAMVTCVMMVIGAGLSFVLPLLATLAVIFGPGLLLFALGGTLTRSHYTYGLSTNQRLAIERYLSADTETKKLFPRHFVETVRAASTTERMDEDYQLAKAAEEIVTVAGKRRKALKLGDEKVGAALRIMTENVDMLQREVEARKEISS